jgi:uncharacterized paraquat-inducible protein A
MTAMSLEARLSAPVDIDLCADCQAFWFDRYENLKISPGSTLKLMKFIGEHTAAGKELRTEELRCPRCTSPLKATNDMQRSTRFSYWRCPQEHGRFIRFFEFLREKDFVRPLTPQQLAELRRNIQTISCSNCGAPIDLTANSSCPHCKSPISMLDMKQPEEMLNQLKHAAERPAIDANLLSLELTKAKVEVETSLRGTESQSGLVEAGLSALARLLHKSGF